MLDRVMGNLLLLVLTAAVFIIFDRPDVAAISPRLSRGYQLLTGAIALHFTMLQWCPDARPVLGIEIAPQHMVIVDVIFMFALAVAALSFVHRGLLSNLGIAQAFGASVHPRLHTVSATYGSEATNIFTMSTSTIAPICNNSHTTPPS